MKFQSKSLFWLDLPSNIYTVKSYIYYLSMDSFFFSTFFLQTTTAELEGEMGDAHMALQARLMSQALRKMTATLSKSNTLLIFINQIRSKIGVIFGSPEITAGGNALKFYASVRIDIRR